MNYLSVENLSKAFGDKVLFDKISFGIDSGKKVAIVARNGSGKTSLLRIIAGLDVADTGKVVLRNNLKTAYLEQETNFENAITIADALTNNMHLADVLTGTKTTDELNDDELTQLGKIKTVAGKLSVDYYAQHTSALSGGQKKRLALAQVLIADADFIILDEPTNHLDIEMIEWLQGYLSSINASLLMVTHDRYFLDHVCNEILELDNGILYRHKGNYSYYLEKRALRLESESATVTKAQNLYRKELDWMRRMPQARGTKAKARVDAFYETEQVAKKNIAEKNISLDINISRIGSKIVEIHKASKSFGEKKIISGFDYTFRKGEKIGIVGPNGIGKSTLLNLITGRLQPDKGKIVMGETIVPGYFEQQPKYISADKRVIEVVRDIAEFIPMTLGRKISAIQLLERFLFPSSMHFQYVSKLSGGEKRRLYLLTVLMQNPNLLILDEPTNDLDIDTLAVLEDYLESFEGCVMMVTHDRFFMDKVADHIFVFEGDGEIKVINGNYNDYRRQKAEKNREQKKVEKKLAESLASPSEKKEKKKLTFKEKLEFENLEKEIFALEEQKAEIEQQLSSGTLHTEKIHVLSKQLSEMIHDIDSKTKRWMELSEWA